MKYLDYQAVSTVTVMTNNRYVAIDRLGNCYVCDLTDSGPIATQVPRGMDISILREERQFVVMQDDTNNSRLRPEDYARALFDGIGSRKTPWRDTRLEQGRRNRALCGT